MDLTDFRNPVVWFAVLLCSVVAVCAIERNSDHFTNPPAATTSQS